MTDAELSPDGTTVAVAFSRADFAANSRPSSLELIDVASGARHAIATTHHDVKLPRWAPDSRSLAFVAGEAKKAQAFVLDVATRAERQLTHAKQEIDDLAWSEDSSQLAYLSKVPVPAGWLEPYGDAFEAGDDSYLATARPDPDQLFIVGADGKGERALTAGPENVPAIAGWHGSEVIVQHAPDAYDSHSWKGSILAIDARSGAVRELVASATNAVVPGFDSSGTRFAYTAPEGPSPLDQQGLFVRAATETRELTHALDRGIAWAGWLGPEALLVIAVDQTRMGLWKVALDGTARRIDTGDADASRRASIARNGTIAFIGTTPARGPEVYLVDATGGRPRALTNLNPPLEGVLFGRSTAFAWDGPDGFREFGVVTYPPNFDRTREYPLIVKPPGGPGGASIEGGDWIRQLFASRGYVVFSPNYRGCDNAGRRYRAATIDDILEGPGRDIMAGIAALERAGGIDLKRVAITGHSEGGLFTAYLAAKYDIWKAAVAVDGDYDLRDEYDYGATAGNQNGAYTFLRGSTQTKPGRETYLRNSPLTYAAGVRVPLLLIHFIGDPLVPVTAAYKERRALLDNGVKVTMVLFPVNAHWPDDPVHVESVARLWLDWLMKRL